MTTRVAYSSISYGVAYTEAKFRFARREDSPTGQRDVVMVIPPEVVSIDLRTEDGRLVTMVDSGQRSPGGYRKFEQILEPDVVASDLD